MTTLVRWTPFRELNLMERPAWLADTIEEHRGLLAVPRASTTASRSRGGEEALR
jgi:hypothetical protein